MPKKAPSFQPRRSSASDAALSIELRRRDRERERKAALDRHRPSAHARGYDARWRRYRIVFLKDNPLCVDCLERGVIEPATEVDHDTPHRGDKDLFWDPDNHKARCKPCHSRKTAKEDSTFARG